MASQKTPLDLAKAFQSQQDKRDAAGGSAHDRPHKKPKRWSTSMDFGIQEKAQTQQNESQSKKPFKTRNVSRPFPVFPSPDAFTQGSPANSKERRLSALQTSPPVFKAATSQSPVASTSRRTLDTAPSFKATNIRPGNEDEHLDRGEEKAGQRSVIATSLKLQQNTVTEGLANASSEQLDPSPRKNRKGQKPRFGLYRRAEEFLARQQTDVFIWSQSLSSLSQQCHQKVPPDLPTTALEGALQFRLRSFRGMVDCGKTKHNPVLVEVIVIADQSQQPSSNDSGLVLLSPVILTASKSAPKLFIPLSSGDGVLSLYPDPEDIQAACQDSLTLWLFQWTEVALPLVEGATEQHKVLLSNRYAIQKPP